MQFNKKMIYLFYFLMENKKRRFCRRVINFKSQLFMKKYKCSVCDWIYDPAVGDPEGGIAPGTAFEDIPDDWVCPLCGVGKDDFEEVDE